MQWYQIDPSIFDHESRQGRFAGLPRDITRSYIAPMLMYPYEIVAWHSHYLMRDSRDGSCYINGREVLRNAKMLQQIETGWMVSSENTMELRGLWGKYYSTTIPMSLLGMAYTCGARRSGDSIEISRPSNPDDPRTCGCWLHTCDISAPEEFTRVVRIVDLGNSGLRVFLWDGGRRLHATHIPNFDVPIAHRNTCDMTATIDLPWVPVSISEISEDDIDGCWIVAPWGKIATVTFGSDW